MDTADYRELRLLVAPDASPPEDPAQAERWWLEVLRGELKRDPGLAAHLRSFLGVAPAPPVAGAVRNSLAGGTAHGPVVQAGTIGTLTPRALPSAALPDPGGWPTVGQLSPSPSGCGLPTACASTRSSRATSCVIATATSVWRWRRPVRAADSSWCSASPSPASRVRRWPRWAGAGRPPCLRARGRYGPAGLPALLQGRPERHVLWLDDLDEHLGKAAWSRVCWPS
ncbi:hypothetical protein O1L55_17410 [Streptomyces albulus]|nr:hypothetical protein [Streptomyces noursei]